MSTIRLSLLPNHHPKDFILSNPELRKTSVAMALSYVEVGHPSHPELLASFENHKKYVLVKFYSF